VSELADTDQLEAGADQQRTLGGLGVYFLKLGTWGFGGPIALCGYMRRDLVVHSGWYTEDEYHKASRSRRRCRGRSPPSSRCGWATSSAAPSALSS